MTNLLRTFQAKRFVRNASPSYQKALWKYSDDHQSSGKLSFPLLWWRTPDPGNFGDWLSPVLFETLFEAKPFHIGHRELNRAHVLGIGSIAKFANNQSIVLGAGISAQNQIIASAAKPFLLRGPFSAKAIEGAPRHRSDIPLGDPGILLKEILDIHAPATKDQRLAFVPHYVHENYPANLGEGIVQYRIWANSLAEMRLLWRRISSHSGLITSSLHAFIGAQSLGIPVALVNLDSSSGSVSGDGIKYKDYARGAGVSIPERVHLSEEITYNLGMSLLTHEQISQEKIREVRSALEEGLGFYFSQHT